MTTNISRIIKSCLLTALWGLYLVCFARGNCPDNTDTLERLGTTQYYAAHDVANKVKFNWAEAQAKCQEYGMDLAVIDSYGADASAGRALEEKVRSNPEVYGKRPFLWIGAKYDPKKEAYVWNTNISKEILNYNNIFYEGIRTIGYGQDLSNDGNLWKPIPKTEEKCLAYGISFDTSSMLLYADNCPGGYETRQVERNCSSYKSSFAMCEAKGCEDIQRKNETIFTSAKEAYMTEGHWIFGNPRRFVISWKPRDKQEAESHCESLGMQLYHPTKTDGCLIPYLALWNRRITTANFWTAIEYTIGLNFFTFPDGEQVPDKKPYANVNSSTGRSNEIVEVCVVAAYSYEPVRNETCPYCRWNAMTIIPANCGIKVATLCSRVDPSTNNVLGSCGNYWGQGNEVYDNLDNPTERQRVINETHSIPFGNDFRNNELYRSSYKQRFGNRLCPDNNKGYKLATSNRTIPLPDGLVYKYDGEETYWVADPILGHRLNGTSCMLSVYNKADNKRTIKTGVNCKDWHFYLCEKRHKKKSKGKRSIIEEDNELDTTEPASNYFPDWE